MRADDELAAVPMLGTLTRDRRRQLAAEHPVRLVRQGAVLARCGEPAHSLFVVQSGEVSGVVEHRDGSRTRYPVSTGPCVLDKASAIHGDAHTATWTTVSACRVRTLPAATFRQLLRDVPGLREHVLRLLSAQVQDARRALADRDAPSAVVKVSRWLLAHPRAERSPIVLPTGQQGLAEELGLSRVTVNRALRHLARASIVHTGPHGVTVLDHERLAQSSD